MEMKTQQNRFRQVMGASAVLALGVLAAELSPAFAKPPPHAPAHGYRRKHESGSDRSDYSRRYDRDDYRRSDGRVFESGRVVNDRRRRVRAHSANDIDGDGIRNDRDPDMDGDGVRNSRDRDMDGDGTPNNRDDHPRGYFQR
jgi:hypothetical protein